MKTAVVTPAHGRHAHLRLQERSLARSVRAPDLRVVVAMDDPDLPDLVDAGTTVVSCPASPDGLPLAHARNLGARTALDAGAELLVFLDVDCLVAPTTLGAYERAAAAGLTGRDLLTGPTGYLPDPGAPGYDLDALPEARFHASRPRPAAGSATRGVEHTLFWSLSFATLAVTWATIGGFDEAYRGYGGEDTDFALRAALAGVDLTFVGDALTWHQWHPVSSPPVEHLDDLLRNGAVFAERWGWWPMQGWFEQLASSGLVEPAGAGWRRTAAPVRATVGPR